MLRNFLACSEKGRTDRGLLRYQYSSVAKTITNDRADAMKRSCSDTLMYFHNENRPFSESPHRLALHLCDCNIILCRIIRLFIVSALLFMQRLGI